MYVIMDMIFHVCTCLSISVHTGLSTYLCMYIGTYVASFVYPCKYVCTYTLQKWWELRVKKLSYGRI